MADLNDLNLSDKVYDTDVDFDNMPTGIGASIIEPPQPGIYLFRLPAAQIIASSFEKIPADQTDGQGERLAAIFRDVAALFNVTLRAPYNARVTNKIRIINRRGQEPLSISDMAQILKSVDCLPANSSNRAYAEALIAAAEREFVAENVLSATCNPKSGTYRLNEATGRSELTTIKGCGQKFKQRGYTPRDGRPAVAEIPTDSEGKFALRFSCPCGAEIRTWGNLQGIRPAK